MRYTVLLTIALLAFMLAPSSAPAANPDQRVLIVVMDGLRPDSITAEQMPTLYALKQQGVFFKAHHSIYPSSTQVNGTAAATGMKPSNSNIISNKEYRPELELLRPIDMNDEYYAWKADNTTDDPFIRAQTLPELARANGLTTAVAGSKAVAILWDRSFKGRSTTQPTLYEGLAIPSATLDPIIALQGPFPPTVDQKFVVNTARDIWTTRALTEVFWAKGVPNLSVLWLSDPDFSQHGVGVGSRNAKLAYKSADDRLKTALDALQAKGVREKTDIIVVSDHGFSTISRKVDVGDELRKKGGFKAESAWHKGLAKGNIVINGLGGSVSFYIIGHDEKVREKLVDFLQQSSWAGVIFTADGADGTFKLSDIDIDSPNPPDVMVAMRWKDEVSEYGTRGTAISDGADRGQGMHVTLSKYEIANTLIAAGPHFRRGIVNNLPSSNADVAPTLAHILNLQPAKPMDGRILHEALVGYAAPAWSSKPQTMTLRTGRAFDDFYGWSQYLTVTKYDGRTYFDEGNGGPTPEP